MAAAADQLSVGAIVTARPWVRGYEQEARTGIVIGDFEPSEYTTVWFHTLGELSRDDGGYAVQAILTSKIQVTGSLADWKPATLKRLTKRVTANYHSRDIYVLNALGTAYRTATSQVAA